MKTLRATAAALLILGAAAAAPALAQPEGGRGSPQFTSGSKGGAVGSFRGGRNSRNWKYDDWQKPDRRDRCRKRRCRDRDYFYGFGYALDDADLLAGGKYGYFSHGAGAGGMSGGSPRFDYDRGYPYEYYSGPAHVSAGEMAPMMEPRRRRHCEVEGTRDARSGRTVEVRVCRN